VSSSFYFGFRPEGLLFDAERELIAIAKFLVYKNYLVGYGA